MRRSWLGALYLSSAAGIWGGMYVVSKVVLDSVPAMSLVVFRFVVAAIVLGVVLACRRQTIRITRKHLISLAGYGFIGYTVSIGAQFLGTQLSSAYMGAVITSASPAFIALFALWLLKETMTRVKMVALFLATVGVVIISGLEWDKITSSDSVGNLFLLLAAVTWAWYSVLGKRLTQEIPTLVVSFYATLFGIVFTLPFSVAEFIVKPFSIPTDVGTWLGIFYLGAVSTALAFFLWTKGFEMMEAGKAGLFFFVQPVVGALLGWWLLGEKFTDTFFIGAILIFLSVGITMRKPIARQQERSIAENSYN